MVSEEGNIDQPIVIIGGDAAGMSAASRLRRELPDVDMIVFEKGEHISYSACGMPYWIGGLLESERKLIILTPQIARRRRHIDVRTRHEATAINPSHKTVSVCDLDSGTLQEQPYGKLLIATGARPAGLPIPGAESPGVFTLRTLGDGQRIHHYLEITQPRRAVIIGGGYTGVEMAEGFQMRGLSVHVVELLPQLMPNFDPEMTHEVQRHLQEMGVSVSTTTRVKSIRHSPEGTLTVVTDGDAGDMIADIVLIAAGIRPNAELAAAAGLRTGESGAIWTDRHLRTSVPHIYAAGDCAEYRHLVLGENAWIPQAPSANKGGRIVADNLVAEAKGSPLSTFPGILGTAVIKVFDYTMARTGLTEAEAKQCGLFGAQGEHVVGVTIENPDKTGYWPSATPLKVKLVIDARNGRILGSQIVGKDGVNKRIDIIVTAISANMTVDNLGLLDLSYAPPYSPTFDPVQICANVAKRHVAL